MRTRGLGLSGVGLFALLGIGVFLVAPRLDAEPPARFTTTFTFETHFGDGKRTYNENQNIAVDVWLPADQGWACIRNTAIPVEGRMRDGFTCSSDGWKTEVLTMVGCKADAADPLHTAGMRLFAPRPGGLLQGAVADAGAAADAGAVFPFGLVSRICG